MGAGRRGIERPGFGRPRRWWPVLDAAPIDWQAPGWWRFSSMFLLSAFLI